MFDKNKVYIFIFKDILTKGCDKYENIYILGSTQNFILLFSFGIDFISPSAETEIPQHKWISLLISEEFGGKILSMSLLLSYSIFYATLVLDLFS